MDRKRVSAGAGVAALVLLALVSSPMHPAGAAGPPRPGARPAEPPVRTRGADVAVRLPSGRSYVEHVAVGRPGAGRGPGRPAQLSRRPLVVALHGWRNDPASLAAAAGLDGFADAHAFLLAYGVGLGRSWNAGGCCAPAASSGSDDVAYLAEVVASMAGRRLVDGHRVYVLGFSNGGMLAERAACERPGLFAAAGSVAGPLLVRCASPVPVRLVQLHGLEDRTVPYAGGSSASLGLTLPSSAALPRVVAGQVPGSTVALVGIPGLGHRWPNRRRDGLDGTAELWSFLSAWSR